MKRLHLSGLAALHFSLRQPDPHSAGFPIGCRPAPLPWLPAGPCRRIHVHRIRVRLIRVRLIRVRLIRVRPIRVHLI